MLSLWTTMRIPISFPSVVYGTLLNDRATLERMAQAMGQPPHKAPPVAPVLYIKTANTYAAPGADVAVPADPGVVRIDAALGVVFRRDATRVRESQAHDYVAGYLIASDVTLPHDNYYRPPLRERCRDGFCPMTACLSPGADFDADHAEIAIAINGRIVHRRNLESLVRPIARLIADVTEYMTIPAGGVLLVGTPEDAPLAYPGDEVRIDVAGLGSLTHRLVAQISDGEST